MGLITFVLKWALKLAIPIVIIGAIFLYLGQGLQDASLDKFDLSGIKDVSSESFTLVGSFFVKNPSDISVPVKSIDYDVILKETGEKIGSGQIDSFTLESDDVTEIPFEQEVQWVPTAELAADLVMEDEVLVEVKGMIHIDLPKVEEYGIPFSEETDIKAYVTQFVPEVDDVLPDDGDEGPGLPVDETPEEDEGLIPDILG